MQWNPKAPASDLGCESIRHPGRPAGHAGADKDSARGAFEPPPHPCARREGGRLRRVKNWPWVKIRIVPPSEHPNPTTRIGSKMGGAPTPNWDSIGFDPQPTDSHSRFSKWFNLESDLERRFLRGIHQRSKPPVGAIC